MLVLLDECLPWRLRGALSDHDVRTVQFMGWSGTKNGALLKLMVDVGFQSFITNDRNLQFQQNLQSAGIGVIILSARSNRTADVLPLVPQIHAALNHLRPGDLIRLEP